MAKINGDIAASGNGIKPLIVFLGDYVDRGMRSRQVIDQIIALAKEGSVEVRSLLGNHEEAMLSFLDSNNSGVGWGRHGGLATLGSYGVTLPRGAGNADDWKRMRAELEAQLPKDHLAFLRDLEKYVVIGDIVFVHAGLRAGVPLADQELRDLLYIRKDFMNTPVDSEKLIVHGHTPGDHVYGAQGRVCLDTGAYATGILTAVRFSGTAPVIIDVGRKT
jgi:diadenosine tetraphosphatase ApaH/serine/threonine PP2A family protein phosphatase